MTAMRVAVLGVGNRAQDHLRTISRMEALCRLVGVCDADANRAAAEAAIARARARRTMFVITSLLRVKGCRGYAAGHERPTV